MKNNLRSLRIYFKLSQSDLALKSGLSRQSISSFERGEFSPTVLNAYKLIHVFNDLGNCDFSIDDIFPDPEKAEEWQH